MGFIITEISRDPKKGDSFINRPISTRPNPNGQIYFKTSEKGKNSLQVRTDGEDLAITTARPDRVEGISHKDTIYYSLNAASDLRISHLALDVSIEVSTDEIQQRQASRSSKRQQ